jgi:hypothetical protein
MITILDTRQNQYYIILHNEVRRVIFFFSWIRDTDRGDLIQKTEKFVKKGNGLFVKQ